MKTQDNKVMPLRGNQLKYILFTVALGLAGAFGTVQAADGDRIDLEKIQIQGASELPKVLYIVPWKRAEIEDSPVEVDSMVDEVMVPIDREVLHRQVEYYEQGVFGQ